MSQSYEQAESGEIESSESGSRDSEVVEKLANDFVQQVRTGHRPTSAELEEQFPDLSGEIVGLTKTLSILEEASIRRVRARPTGTVVDAAGKRQQMLGGFRLVREISRGGMGIVYEAEQESLSRRVAVKVLPPSPLLTEVERTRFEREGYAVARLHHSNIVPVFGTGEQDGVQYCVMQYIDGCSLDKLIAALRARFRAEAASEPLDDESSDADIAVELLLRPEMSETNVAGQGGLAKQSAVTPTTDESGNVVEELPKCFWQNVARIGARIAAALSHAHHQGVLHRDIKPANLLLDRKGFIWLTDFGLAKLHDKENLTVSGNMVGTLRYTAPEQFNGEADARSDVYGLGLTLHEMCTLEPAFAASDRRELMRKVMTESPPRPRSLNPRIPRDLETIILKAIAPEPDNRYQSAGDLAADLRNYLDRRPLIARRQSAWVRGWRWCSRHPLETALGGFALGMMLLFSLTTSLAYFREARLRHESDENAAVARQALDRVYDSFLPDWTTSSTVSAHGMVSVSPDTARLLEELVEYYDDLARRGYRDSEKSAVLESAAAQRRVGLIYLRLGQLSKARTSYTRANDRLEQYHDKYPGKELRLEQAKVLNELGSVFWTARRLGEARRNHQQALGLVYETLPAPKDDIAVQFELARTLYLYGRRGRGLGGGVMRQLVDVDDDIRSIDQPGSVARAAMILETLLDRYPENLEIRHLLALCYREHADRSIDEDGEPADESMKQAIWMLEELVDSAPDHPTYRFALCTTLQWCRLGEVASQDVCDFVAERMQRSAELAEQLSRQRPDEWIYAATRVEALIKQANVLNRAKRLEEALLTSQQAIDSASALSAKFQDCGIFQLWSGHARRRRGDLLKQTSENELTLSEYDRAIVDLEGLLHDDRSDFEIPVLKNLQRAYSGRSEILARLNDSEASRLARQRADEFAERFEVAHDRSSE